MGKIGYIVSEWGMPDTFVKQEPSRYILNDPRYKVQPIVYFKLENDND